MTKTIRIGPLELRFPRDKHETKGSLDRFKMTVPHGGQMPVAHYHRDWDESVDGLEGIFIFTVAGAEHEIGPGQTMSIPHSVVHGFDNHSGADAVVLSSSLPTCSPPNASGNWPNSSPTGHPTSSRSGRSSSGRSEPGLGYRDRPA